MSAYGYYIAGPIKSNWLSVTSWSVFQYPITYEYFSVYLHTCMDIHNYVHVYLSYVASVSSLISGDPYDDINVNNTSNLYISAFETSLQIIGVSDYYLVHISYTSE